ncbi:MAG: hypothetical protein ACE5EM_01555 [Sphingomonadales bacterium]
MTDAGKATNMKAGRFTPQRTTGNGRATQRLDSDLTGHNPSDSAEGCATATERLLALWYHARGRKGYVTKRQAGPERLRDLWPRCFMVDQPDRAGALVFTRIARLPLAAGGGVANARDGAMLLEWITDLARKALASGLPIARRDFFPCGPDGTEYNCVTLPLTDDLGLIRSVIGVVEMTGDNVREGILVQG